MSKKKTFEVTEEMLKGTKHGYKLMMELRMYCAVYGPKEFNEKFGSNISGLGDIPFDPSILPAFSGKN